jgi:serine/threonine protein phosphatase PrpC
MEFAFRSELGAAARNEDNCLVSEALGFFAVCDGLSVKSGGEVAAKLAGETLQAWVGENQALLDKVKAGGAKEDKKALEEALAHGFQNASRVIFQHSSTDPSLHGMCTSVDVVLILGSHALVGHVGAGRVYIVRKGEAHLLTEDHTQAAYLRRLGKLSNATPQQVAAYARRLTRAVGYQEDVKADTLLVELEPGDRFVVMTDGVWQPVGDTTIFGLAARNGAAQEILDAIHAVVTETGARDNFTTLVLDPQAAAVPVQAGAEQKLKMLGKVPAFEYLSYQELMKVLSVGDLVKVPSGQPLCKEGDRGGEMMLLISGSADVTKNGKAIRRLGRGDVFGEMSMIDSAPRSASVVAGAPTSVLAFPRDALFALFREDPTLSVKFLWGVTMEMNKRLRAASNQLVGRPENEGAPAADKKALLPFQRSM